ncbi:MAG: sulfite exporter TauE/SafE family protein [Thermoplasmatales archaeon]
MKFLHQDIPQHLNYSSHINFKKLFFVVETSVIVIVAILLTYYRLILDGPTNFWVLVFFAMGFGLALMDSSMAMGYGTIGTPLLLLLGFSPRIVVPSILISQTFGAFTASVVHHANRNVNYLDFKGSDFGILARFLVLGIIGVVIAMILIIQISKTAISVYIGALLITMGFTLLLNPSFKFSWLKVSFVSLISGFNKAISGGGYGPVATAGLLISGNPPRQSVGITLFSVAVINSVAFVGWSMTKTLTSFELPIFLIVGSLFGSQVGPFITRKANPYRSRIIFACVATVLGCITIITTLFK